MVVYAVRQAPVLRKESRRSNTTNLSFLFIGVHCLADMASRAGPVRTPPTRLSRHNSPRTKNDTDSEYGLPETMACNESRLHRQELGRDSTFEDVTIPTNILRYANTAKEWAPNAEITETQNHQQADSSPKFNVVDIALEQQAVIDYALGSVSRSRVRHSTRPNINWDNGQERD